MSKQIPVLWITKHDPSRFDIYSFEYFIERLKEKIVPGLDDSNESLLNNQDCIELLRKCWWEGYDNGYSYGYNEGYENGIDQ